MFVVIRMMTVPCAFGSPLRLNVLSLAKTRGYQGQFRFTSSGKRKWLWPVDKEALNFHVAHDYGTRIGCFRSTINSSKELKGQEIKTSLYHCQRKFPDLRICIRNREDVLWFCEEEGSEIDFKIEHGDEEDVVNSMYEKGFSDVAGVPWKVRLIPRGTDAPCAMPEVKTSHPHQYDCLLMGHHGLGNGVSVASLVKRMIELLNDVMSGRDIDETECTQFIQPEETIQLESVVRKKLEEDSSRLDFVKKSLPSANYVPLFLKAFPRLSEVSHKTGHVSRSLDVHSTQQFQRQCKANGVSFNSAFTAVVNTAMALLIQERGVSLPSYRIVSGHIVNVSRYLKRTPTNAPFAYSLLLSHGSDVYLGNNHFFWDYARVVNTELQGALVSGLPLEQKMVRQMTQPEVSPKLMENPPPVVHDFGITNVGHFPTPERRIDDHVIMTDASSFCSVHRFVHMNYLQIFTFRGRCMFTMSYAVDCILEENVKLLADKVISVLKEVVD